jgi:hypothetical protein
MKDCFAALYLCGAVKILPQIGLNGELAMGQSGENHDPHRKGLHDQRRQTEHRP